MNIKTDIFEITDDVIIIYLDTIVSKDSVVHQEHRERVENAIADYYNNQTIVIRSHDGANLERTGILNWVEYLQRCFDLSSFKIVFNTINPPYESADKKFPWLGVELKAFIDAGEFIEYRNINRNLKDAKFVGALAASRWTLWRLKLIYELDQAFPDDTYITHNKEVSEHHLSFCPELIKETEWIQNKKFEKDPGVRDNSNSFRIDYRSAYSYYSKIWDNYHIEAVMETDEYQNKWFTDKVGKCLATGKPFVMLAGTDSLKNLNKLGFKTYSELMDESYDQCKHPGQRIKHMIASLKEIYQHPNREEILGPMRSIAMENVEVYNYYVNSKKNQ